jgi:UDP-N-acetylmuramoyl-tripeptide--D-alanyl-D-alanine ligase
MRFWAGDVAAATGGTLVGADVPIDGTSFDSRTLQPGQLFVPLIDQRDGHDFIDVAMARGAAATLTSRAPAASFAGTAIVVGDTLQALMSLATELRSRSTATVVGITGSVGKTSTKDFALAALSASRRTWANERSFNNEQGLPTTIVNAPDDTQVMVVEMGMRGFGEIARLCQIARPHIGIVTRVAEAHGDRVGGIDGVALAKAELIDSLPSDGIAILNGDDPLVRAMGARFTGRIITFGASAGNDVIISNIIVDDLARPSCTLTTPWGSLPMQLLVSGRHMAHNAAAAIACVGAIGGDVGAAAEAIAGVRLTSMRMEVVRASSGALILNDSYNANPTSMRAALDALADMPADRRFAVLGVMAEITDAAHEHATIAQYAEQRGVRVIATATQLYGSVPTDDPVAALGHLRSGDVVLVKGSRVAGLERVAAALIGAT